MTLGMTRCTRGYDLVFAWLYIMVQAPMHNKGVILMDNPFF